MTDSALRAHLRRLNVRSIQCDVIFDTLSGIYELNPVKGIVEHEILLRIEGVATYGADRDLQLGVTSMNVEVYLVYPLSFDETTVCTYDGTVIGIARYLQQELEEISDCSTMKWDDPVGDKIMIAVEEHCSKM